MNEAKYIGLDVHQATISVAVLDFSGKLLMEAILETQAATVAVTPGPFRQPPKQIDARWPTITNSSSAKEP